MWCKYSHPGSGLYPGFMDQGKYQTYYTFGKTGLIVNYDSQYVGHALDGEAAFGDWLIDDENKTVRSTTTKTQTIWFRQDSVGNADSTATDYVAEVTVRGVDGEAGQYAGLMSMQSKTEFSFYTVNIPSITNGKVYVRSASEMDGGGWMSSIGFEKTVVQSGYESDSVKLTVIKRGGDLYYLCNGEYVGTEYIEKISDKNVVGFYANGAAEFTDWSFTDYTGKTDELNEILAEHIWFVRCSKEGQGTVMAERIAVPKEDGRAVITVMPRTGYILTDLLFNGVSVYEDYLENVQNYQYSCAMEGDLQVRGIFKKLPTNSIRTVFVTFKDATTNEVIKGVNAEIVNDNTLLSSMAQVNTRGIVYADLLPAGTYTIEGRTVVSDGEYVLKASTDGYHDRTFTFTVDANVEDANYEVALTSVNWGALTLNGKATTTTGRINLYDGDNGIYGIENNATVKQYLLDTKTNTDYVVKAKVTAEKVTDVGNVVGVMLSAGGYNYILLKSCSWEANKLCLEVYNKNNATAEISITGFKHNIGAAGGELSFTAVRMGETIYVCDANGEMAFYMDKDGVHTQGSHGFGSSSKLSNVNEALGQFFECGAENGVGLVQYYNKGGKYWYDVQTTIGENAALNFFDGVTMTMEESSHYNATIDGVMPVGDKFARNTGVTVTVTGNLIDQVVKGLKLAYDDEEVVVAGNYDANDNSTTFDFILKGNCTATVLFGLADNVIGDVTLNGKTTSVQGTTLYDAENDVYGTGGTGNVRRYFVNTKTDGDYVAKLTVKVAEKSGAGNVVGFALGAGNACRVILKSTSWEANRLCLELRNSDSVGIEIPITDFAHTLGSVGGSLSISVVRLDDVIYVYNSSDNLGFTLSKAGLVLADGHTTTANSDTISSLNAVLADFFNAGKENAVGLVQYYSYGGEYWYETDMETGADAAESFIKNAITVNGLKMVGEGSVTSVGENKWRNADATTATRYYDVYTAVKGAEDFVLETDIEVVEKAVFGGWTGVSLGFAKTTRTDKTLADSQARIDFRINNWDMQSAQGKILTITCRRSDGYNMSIQVKGFNADIGRVGGTTKITLVRLNGKLYVYDGTDALVCYMDATGVYGATESNTVTYSGSVSSDLQGWYASNVGYSIFTGAPECMAGLYYDKYAADSYGKYDYVLTMTKGTVAANNKVNPTA